jgi:hypothetical protein
MSVGFLHYVKALACPFVFTASAVSCAASAATPPPDAGVLIYSRPVFKAAEVRGEPATPNQVELTSAIPWQGSLQPMTALTDDEAAAIGASVGGQTAGLVGEALLAALGDAGVTGSAGQVLHGQGADQMRGGLSAMHGALGMAGAVIGRAVGAAVGQGRN